MLAWLIEKEVWKRRSEIKRKKKESKTENISRKLGESKESSSF